MTRTAIALAAAAVLAAAALPTPTLAQSNVKIGTLDCDISGGIGLVIGSKKEMSCSFLAAAGGRRETYLGSISKFGLDIGATTGGRMVWAVYAPSEGFRGSLAGRYAGATAEATVGAGLGANVLVGGSHRTIALQPLSVQGQTGLNLAVGVAGLNLHRAHLRRVR